MAADPLQTERVLLVHWPRRLALPADRTGIVTLLGTRCDDSQPELLVAAAAGTAEAAATMGSGHGSLEPVAALLCSPDEQPPSPASGPAFVLQPARVPGCQLPLLVPPAAPAVPARARTRSASRQQQQHQQQQQQQQHQQQNQQHQHQHQHQQHPYECEVILYDRWTQPQLASRGGCCGLSTASGRRQQQDAAARHRKLAARLASHLLGALLAWVLLAHRAEVATAAASCGTALAGFAARQLAWLLTAQPAGVKLHRQLCELLGVSGLQYVAAVRRLLAGRGRAITTGPTGLLAASLAALGPRRGLAVLQCLLWAAALPVSLPYAAMAATYRWQLRSTAVMWRVMRGKQRLPLLRERAAGWLQRWGPSRGGGGRKQQAAPTRPASPRAAAAAGPPARKFGFSSGGGSGLKQLSGSMLLFMPLLLLLPTTAAFYALALGLHAACCLPRAAALLAERLLQHSPAAAAAQAWLQLPAGEDRSNSDSSSGGGGTGGGDGLQYRVLHAEFDRRALAANAALQAAAQRTTYLVAQRRHGSPWQAALQAARQAWAACNFLPPGRMALAVLGGRPLWLAMPGLRIS